MNKLHVHVKKLMQALLLQYSKDHLKHIVLRFALQFKWSENELLGQQNLFTNENILNG